MSDALYTRLQALLGPGGVERDAKGLPVRVPESDDALAMVCALASEEGWKLRLEGAGTWLPADAPADLSLSTRSLNRLIALNPADLVATVQPGMPIEALQSELFAKGMWLAMDPPGRPERTIGSIVATGTAGPLRLGFGPVRDHVLGCTAATGDGRLVSAGGRVVKNVAGYDLTKLHVGGFGGFGAIAELHLRLRALPEVDSTLLARGTRDAMVRAGRDAREAQSAAVALELFSPALAADAEWVLAARLIGATAAVEAEREQLAKATGLTWDPVPSQRRVPSGDWQHEGPSRVRSPSGWASCSMAWTTRSIWSGSTSMKAWFRQAWEAAAFAGPATCPPIALSPCDASRPPAKSR